MVNRTFVSFPIADFQHCKMQLLNWANQFTVSCILDNQQYSLPHNSFECLAAAGVVKQVTASAGNAFHQLQSFLAGQQDWVFGHLGYDLKNELEPLSSAHRDNIGFPDLFFYIPEVIVQLNAQ